MDKQSIIFGIIGIAVIGIAGFFLTDLISSPDYNDLGNDASDTQLACSNELEAMHSSLEEGSTREIPGICFEDEEFVTSALSGAEPGDKIRKTSDGLEVVE